MNVIPAGTDDRRLEDPLQLCCFYHPSKADPLLVPFAAHLNSGDSSLQLFELLASSSTPSPSRQVDDDDPMVLIRWRSLTNEQHRTVGRKAPYLDGGEQESSRDLITHESKLEIFQVSPAEWRSDWASILNGNIRPDLVLPWQETKPNIWSPFLFTSKESGETSSSRLLTSEPTPPPSSSLTPARFDEMALTPLTLELIRTVPPSSLNPFPVGSGLAIAFQTKIERVASLLRATRNDICDVAAQKALINELNTFVGLGNGLTPSGDDFLVGMAAVLCALQHPLAPALAQLCGEAARSPVKTTFVARAFLAHAALGRFSEFIHCLVTGLLFSSSSSFPHSFSAPSSYCQSFVCPDQVLAFCSRFGASSGRDSLLGVVVTLHSLLLNPL